LAGALAEIRTEHLPNKAQSVTVPTTCSAYALESESRGEGERENELREALKLREWWALLFSQIAAMAQESPGTRYYNSSYS
jgi:hypothetical protein